MKSPNGKVLNLYHTSWSNYGRNFQISDLAQQIEAGATDVSYAFFNLKQEGNGWVIFSADSWAEFEKTYSSGIQPPDTWEDSSAKKAGNFGQLRKLKNSGAQFNLHLSIGGWTWSKNFSLAVRTAESREMLANSIITFFQNYSFFNGVDFDWEYLSNDNQNYGLDGNVVHPDDCKNFKSFLTLLRGKMNSSGFSSYLIGMCVVAAPDKMKFDIDQIHPLIEEIRIMTYDFAGAWDLKAVGHQTNPRKSKYGPFSVEQAVDFYISKGVPANKLLIGVAFYSRGWSGTSGLGQPATGNSPDFQFTEETGVVPYHMLPVSGATEFWDDEAKATYSYDSVKKVLNTYDSVNSVLEKCKIVHEKGLKGIIVWESSGDTKPSNPRSLVAAIKKGLFSTTTPPTTTPPTTTPPTTPPTTTPPTTTPPTTTPPTTTPPTTTPPTTTPPTTTPPTTPPTTTPPTTTPPTTTPPTTTPPTTPDQTWVSGRVYLAGNKVIYNNMSYICKTNHTSSFPCAPGVSVWTLTTPPPTTTPTPPTPPTTTPTPTPTPPTTTPTPILNWVIGIQYQNDQLVSYQGSIYKCINSHKSIETWAPGIYTQSLWKKQ